MSPFINDVEGITYEFRKCTERRRCIDLCLPCVMQHTWSQWCEPAKRTHAKRKYTSLQVQIDRFWSRFIHISTVRIQMVEMSETHSFTQVNTVISCHHNMRPIRHTTSLAFI